MDGRIFISKIWALFFNMKNNLRRLMDPITHAEKLTPMQIYILFEIKQGNINNIGGICHDFGINQGNASTMCKKLEQSGLINRERSTEDERVVTLSITPQGNAILDRIKKHFKRFEEYCSNAPEEKMKTIFKGLTEFEELINDFILMTETNNERIL